MRATHDDVDLVLEVHDRRQVAERVCVFSLRDPAGRTLPAWAPGAHVDVELGNGLVRQYSLCGGLHEDDIWQIAILLEETSRGGSSYAHSDLGIGTMVKVRGPRNLFALEPAPEYLFVAGGIGIAPLVPMIEEVARTGAPWKLAYGGRRRSAMAFADTLAQQYGDNVELVVEDEQGPLPLARLMQFGHSGTAVYCCGPEGLVRAVETIHSRTRRGKLHVERFSPKQIGTPQSGTFEVEAKRSGKVVTVGRGQSILDALGSAGVRVLSSCAEGICGTCEVSVVEGAPEHRDSILSEQERQASETMFVCVSRSLSPRLVLDV